MALRVVENESYVADDQSRAFVVLESDCSGPPFNVAFSELDSLNAKNAAIAWATSRGVSSAGLNGRIVGPYPVNAKGESLDKLYNDKNGDISPQDPSMQPNRYRCSIPIARGFR